VAYNHLIGGAHVVLPPGAATELREHPLIDFIEPNHAEVRVAGARA
jgi:hypothetical protein